MQNSSDGFIMDLPWWAIAIVTLCLTHITIIAVTLFLHHHQAHRAFDMQVRYSRGSCHGVS